MPIKTTNKNIPAFINERFHSNETPIILKIKIDRIRKK
jgi:hypothetical protein